MPLFALRKNIKEMDLVPLLTDYKMPASFGQIYAIYPHRNSTPIVKLFIETVQQLIGDPPMWEKHIDHFDTMYK